MKSARTSAIALEWASATHLPIVGETHPLRVRYDQSLYRALTVALFIHLAAFSGFTIARILHREPVVDGDGITVIIPLLPPPPPIVPRAEPEPSLPQAIPIAPPKFGLPEPVKEWMVADPSFPTNEEFAGMVPPFDPGASGWNEGDSLVVQIPEGQGANEPGPEDFVAAEEMPALINIPAPVYPEMARQAGMEGTVMVRALVGKDGKVQKTLVTASIPMLDDAAIAAVHGAVFRPALQQHKPVAVWVQVPLRFTLR
jgi:periplasmic protein TonB